MRIALVSPGYPPAVGGVETVLEQLAEGLAGAGHVVQVWCHGGPALSVGRVLSAGSQQRDARPQILRFPTTRSGRYPISRQLWRHVAEASGDVDLLHFHNYHSSVLASAVRADVRVPVVASLHFHGTGHTWPARIVHPAYRSFVRSSVVPRLRACIAGTVAETSAVSNAIPELADRIRVVRNAVEVTAIHEAEPFRKIPPTALLVGRLERYKRVDEVIHAFALADVGAAQLVIVGEGPDRGRLVRLAARSAARDRIFFEGHVTRPVLCRWFRSAAVTVSMSERESFGIVAQEAAAAGANLLLSDIPAYREAVVDLPGGIEAVIVSTGEQLAHALPGLLSRGNGGAQSVRTWNDTVRETLAVYRESCGVG